MRSSKLNSYNNLAMGHFADVVRCNINRAQALGSINGGLGVIGADYGGIEAD